MIRLAYRMPAPIAQFATIHHEFLCRFTPRAYWVPVNGKRLFFEGGGAIKRLLEKIDNRYQRGLCRIQRALGSEQPLSKMKDMDQLAHDILAGPLMATVREIIMSDDSFAIEIFGKQGIESILDEHESRAKNHTEVLGLLTAMERWRTMVTGVAQEARRVHS